MDTQRRIETLDAKELRKGRQSFAAPGGFHDRLVKFLGTALPMGVGVIAALMVITPLSPRGEVSFLLDRDAVAIIRERLRVDNALYRGVDDEGRPFSLTADEAVQQSSEEGIVRLKEVEARLLLPDGPGQLTAKAGAYSIESEMLDVEGPLRVAAADGYQIIATGVSIDLERKLLIGSKGVTGAFPAGTFSGDQLEVDLSNRIIALEGNAKLRMVPGSIPSNLRMP